MNTRDKIIKLLKSKPELTSQDIVHTFGITRQTASLLLNELVRDGVLIKSGSTRLAKYFSNKSKYSSQSTTTQLQLIKKLKGLEEDKVASELDLKLRLKKILSENTYKIFQYAFTEMLNNAIDHSRSNYCKIDISLTHNTIYFKIRDNGIGAFENVRKEFKLKTEFEALEHIFKGRQTTDPTKHSGQGIFFTSRIADKFIIKSHKIETTRDNKIDDLFIKDIKSLKGTEVEFFINKKSRRSLKEIFAKHSNDEFEFVKDTVKVKISQTTGALSRSEAKRLLFGLDKFKQITFDFKGVPELGQAFADEIFRVFAKQNPEIKVTFEKANPAVAFMITKAIREARF